MSSYEPRGRLYMIKQPVPHQLRLPQIEVWSVYNRTVVNCGVARAGMTGFETWVELKGWVRPFRQIDCQKSTILERLEHKGLRLLRPLF